MRRSAGKRRGTMGRGGRFACSEGKDLIRWSILHTIELEYVRLY